MAMAASKRITNSTHEHCFIESAGRSWRISYPAGSVSSEYVVHCYCGNRGWIRHTGADSFRDAVGWIPNS